MAAQTLCEEGFGRRVIVLDRENRVPYDRTVLSKYELPGSRGRRRRRSVTDFLQEAENRAGDGGDPRTGYGGPDGFVC